MDNIDVLLKAAEYIEAQEINDQSSHNQLNVESSLSPISSASYSSSSSSSLFNSPNSIINQNTDKNERVFHKKFNNRKLQNSDAKAKNEIQSNNIFSTSLPSNLVSPPSLVKVKKNDEKSSINKSLSRLEEIKRDKAMHNTLEKNRRAHLKECFENLQNELPQYKDKKCTNLAILNYTLKFVEQSKKKDKENEMEKMRLLKKQLFLKQRLKNLVLDFKNQYLEVNSANTDEANSKFNSLLQSLNINPDDCLIDDNQINIEDFDENEDLNLEISNQNTSNAFNYSRNELSPKEIVAKYQRKRSSNSLSVITGSKTLQPNQSLQLQLQNQLKLQKQHTKRITGQRQRHYSVDDSIINRQRHRKKYASISKNDFEVNLDGENDEFDYDDNYSIDETNTTADLDMDSNSLHYDADNTRTAIEDEESGDLIINEDEDDPNDQNKTIKDEHIDVEAFSEKSNSPLTSAYPAKIIIQQSNNLINGLNNRQPQIIYNKATTKVISNSNINIQLSNQQITPVLNFGNASSYLKTPNILNKGSITSGTSLYHNLNLNTVKPKINESTSNYDTKSLNIKSLSISPNTSLGMSIINMKNKETSTNIVKHLIINSNLTQQQTLTDPKK